MTTSLTNFSESDYALDFVGPSEFEQLIVELVNRARLDPTGEATLQSTSLGSGVSSLPSQALAVVGPLDAAAQAHSDAMIAQDFFAHQNPFTGTDASDRARDAGYGRGAGENISFHVGYFDPFSVESMVFHHDNLWESLGHRQNFMSSGYSEIGVGHASGVYTTDGSDWSDATMLTQNFGDRGLTYLTGVVIDDLDGDAFYDVGEGQGDVRITAYNDDGAYATSTWSAGGYSLALEAGAYTVQFEGGDLDGTYVRSVTIGDTNVKLDIIEGRDATDAPSDDTVSDPVEDPYADAELLEGGDFADIINGGDGAERLVGGGGADVLRGGDGGDSLSGGDGADTLRGGAGNDRLTSDAGDDIATGDRGDDTVDGGAGDDIVRGGAGDDTVTGGAGDDTVVGDRGNDDISGGAGNDILKGALDDDTLTGGAGDDILIGGAGADLFVFGQGSGADILRDFTQGDDQIDVSAYGFGSFDEVLAVSTQAAFGVRIRMEDESSVLVRQVTLDDLNASDFIL